METLRVINAGETLKRIKVVYEFCHSKMGFNNQMTVDAFNNEDAIAVAKNEVSQVYGSKMLPRFKFKTIE